MTGNTTGERQQERQRERSARCGTGSGYRRHMREKTLPCEACLLAHSYDSYRFRWKGKCAPGLGWPMVV